MRNLCRVLAIGMPLFCGACAESPQPFGRTEPVLATDLPPPSSPPSPARMPPAPPADGSWLQRLRALEPLPAPPATSLREAVLPLPVIEPQPAPVQPVVVPPVQVQPVVVQPAPVQTAPVQTVPIQPAVVQLAPIQPSPVRRAPVQMVPSAPRSAPRTWAAACRAGDATACIMADAMAGHP